MGRPGSEYAKRKSVQGSAGPGQQRVEFREGPPIRPDIKHDNGFLDKFPRREPTAEDRFRYVQWRCKLTDGRLANFLGLRDLPDALDAYEHFLDGSGEDRTISYDRFVNGDASGALVYNYSLLLLRQAAEQTYHDRYEASVKPGGAAAFFLTGSAIAVGGKDDRFPYPETENWQKTLGAHFIWLSATVTVRVPSGSRVPGFTMFWTLNAEDRYNFNPGAKDIATGTPDDDNGIFEVTGLAKQYMNYATMTQIEAWTGATVDLVQILYGVPGTW